MDASTSKFKDGIGDGADLERVSACAGILGAIQGLFFGQEFGVKKVTPASFNDAARENGGGKGAVVGGVIDALVMRPLSSDSDMRSSSSETFVVVLESVGEEHQELKRPTDNLGGASAHSDGRTQLRGFHS
ncbi:unnamed protein product [Peronospora destructor]|uniref:Uncharacterized protein n=1 Tax=Peronospora destructor TaxID=86335 RepID=A0AAV0U386_9STRA|nr:unnamed protein product [Peronospora destructor]